MADGQAAWKRRFLTTSHTQLNRSNRRHLAARQARTGAQPATLQRKQEASAATARILGELRQLRIAAQRQVGDVGEVDDAQGVSIHLKRLQGAEQARSKQAWELPHSSSSARAVSANAVEHDYFPVSPPRANEEREELTEEEQMLLLQTLRPRTFGSYMEPAPRPARPPPSSDLRAAARPRQQRPASAHAGTARNRDASARTFVRANHYTGSRTIFARSLVTLRRQRQRSAPSAAIGASSAAPCVFRTGGGGLPWWYRGL